MLLSSLGKSREAASLTGVSSPHRAPTGLGVLIHLASSAYLLHIVLGASKRGRAKGLWSIGG